MNTKANPQGKGLVPLLESFENIRRLVRAVPKNIHQISSELFTSLFVLHSQFSFKPVIGKEYWLYEKNLAFRLSLISPAEWGNSEFGKCVGKCTLQMDVTWSLELDSRAMDDVALMSYIESKRDEFEKAIAKSESLVGALPVYIKELPYYQRVYASVLANSLKQSMIMSGIETMSYQEAEQHLLPDTNQSP